MERKSQELAAVLSTLGVVLEGLLEESRFQQLLISNMHIMEINDSQ